jgi:transcriptional regulator with XRE-family HTH domain
MSLGERIEERMRALDLSQAELARRAGVPQTTMNSLVRGNARTTPHLIRIARELRTTPGYLMGETQDHSAEFPAECLQAEELKLLALFRRLPPADRETVLQLSKRLLRSD